MIHNAARININVHKKLKMCDDERLVPVYI